MTFHVDRFPQVNQQINELARQAKALGVRTALVEALRGMLDHLENGPLEWGDPEYHTKQPGGLVCHGIVAPLFVRFVVFEAQQIVIIIDISALPTSPLAGP